MGVSIQIRKGRKDKDSLFLLITKGTKRNTEFLKLYIYKHPKDAIHRQHNKSTWQLARTILLQRQQDYQHSAHGLISPNKEKIGLLTFFTKVKESKRTSIGCYQGWQSAHLHLERFLNCEDIPLKNISDAMLEDYKRFLLSAKSKKGDKPLSRNSCVAYFTKLKVALKEAYIKRYTREDMGARIKTIKGEETQRQFVTMEEIQKLRNTECANPILKKAFLFGCYTGLRFSDIASIEWDQLNYSHQSGWQLTFKQKKTGNFQTLPIVNEAIELLTNAPLKEGKIFLNLKYSGYNNQILKSWFLKAGVTKPLTFHGSRHGFATNLLNRDVHISKIQKLMGHKHGRTTEVYLQVIDSSLREAVGKLSNLDHLN